MDITLEKIDLIRDRTGVSYADAKNALLAADGNVVDAIIGIEEKNQKNWTENFSVKGNEAVEKLKEIVKAGNVNRIRVKKDDTTILDIPITAGAIGAVLIPQITAIGTAVALLTKCTIEVERPNKEVINVSDMITNTVENAADKMKGKSEDNMNMGQNNTGSVDNNNTGSMDNNNNQSNIYKQ